MTTFSTPSYDAPFAPGSPVYYPARWLMTLRLSDIHPWSLLAYVTEAMLSSHDPTRCRDFCHGHCHGTQMTSRSCCTRRASCVAAYTKKKNLYLIVTCYSVCGGGINRNLEYQSMIFEAHFTFTSPNLLIFHLHCGREAEQEKLFLCLLRLNRKYQGLKRNEEIN